MANITEVSQWENVIRQIENGEAATGGADGLANVQAKQLANRTRYLKKNIDDIPNTYLTKGNMRENDGDLTFATGKNVSYKMKTMSGSGDVNSGLVFYVNEYATPAAAFKSYVKTDDNGEIKSVDVTLEVRPFREDYEHASLTLASNGTNGTKLSWRGNNLGDSAIVAKSLGANGYVKYVSGLIVQWGVCTANSTNSGILTLPIAFSSKNYSITAQPISNVSNNTITIDTLNVNNCKYYKTADAFKWIAIGY